MRHVASDQAKAVDAGLALGHDVVLCMRHRDPRHVEQEARVDAVVAGFDAFARKQAAARPFARRLIALALAQGVDNAADDVNGVVPRLGIDAGGVRYGADFHTFTAARAGISHRVGTRLQGGFERLGQSFAHA